MMTRMPVGGVIWQTAHYIVGLQRLGFDVLYAEDHGMHPAMFADDSDPDGSDKAAAFIGRTMETFAPGTQWSYHAWHFDDRYFGVGRSAFETALGRAEAVINMHGGTEVRPEHRRGGAFIYLETDPVAPQIELHNRHAPTETFLEQHTAWFTFGENLGAPDCKVPLPPARFRFRPTRQPIVTDFWKVDAPPGECFTTIANWRQPQRQMTLEGEVYHWSKHHEFLKFMELPKRTAQPFELALSSYEESDRTLLKENGWRVRHALDVSTDPVKYQRYIVDSRGEWTVAKDQNVRLRSGWFSDRAATYLAAGRPVVTQETGFSNVLPTGCGLFAFTNIDEVLGAVAEINSDYERHSHRAREIAREYFEAETVLRRLLQEAGITVPA